jgi:hypothetical protein
VFPLQTINETISMYSNKDVQMSFELFPHPIHRVVDAATMVTIGIASKRGDVTATEHAVSTAIRTENISWEDPLLAEVKLGIFTPRGKLRPIIDQQPSTFLENSFLIINTSIQSHTC